MKKHKRKWIIALWICIAAVVISAMGYWVVSDSIFKFNFDREDLAGVKIGTPTGANITVNRIDDCDVIMENLSSLTLHRIRDWKYTSQAHEFKYWLTLYKTGGGILNDVVISSPHQVFINQYVYEVTSGSFDFDLFESLFEKYQVRY